MCVLAYLCICAFKPSGPQCDTLITLFSGRCRFVCCANNGRMSYANATIRVVCISGSVCVSSLS